MSDTLRQIIRTNMDVTNSCAAAPCAAPNMCRLAGVCALSLPKSPYAKDEDEKESR
jgi:hypothetical protein